MDTPLVSVTVHKPCTCGATRWFLCANNCATWEEVAAYDCQPFAEDAPKSPHPANVAWIEQEHPGMCLRYIHPGGTFQVCLDRERAKLR